MTMTMRKRRVRKITRKTKIWGIRMTVLGLVVPEESLSDGVFALVADTNNHLIRHIVISTASVTTLVGMAGSAEPINGIGTPLFH